MRPRQRFCAQWVLSLLLLALPAVVKAQFTFTTNNDTITITGYTGPGGAVTIPSTINGLPVASIGFGAFCYCWSLLSVTIPTGVTSIGDYAFGNCTNLTNATIPNSVTRIGDDAFDDCRSLTAVSIPDSLTSIGIETFYFCRSLTSITIPNSVTTIGINAFGNCSSLTNATIGTNVTSIGSGAFGGYLRLTNITIPDSVTNIGSGAFGMWPDLTTITVSTNNPAYSDVDGVLFNKSQTTLVQYPVGKAGTNITIPNSVTSIWNEALSGVLITSVTIPTSVTIIGDWAFGYCYNLTSVYFQGNAPSLGGSSVFNGDDNATIYYLIGTTGWSTTFGGRPAVLWNPQAQTIGMLTNGLGFTIAGSSNLVIVVEACTNLASASWTSLQTCTLSNGSIYFSDPQWTNYPARFYRIRSP